MQRRAAEESLTDHGKDNSNGRAHVGDAIRHKPGILGFLRQIGFMGATGSGGGRSRYAAAMRLTTICRSKSRDWERSKAICMPSHVSGVEPKAFDSR